MDDEFKERELSVEHTVKLQWCWWCNTKRQQTEQKYIDIGRRPQTLIFLLTKHAMWPLEDCPPALNQQHHHIHTPIAIEVNPQKAKCLKIKIQEIKQQTVDVFGRVFFIDS